MAYINPYKLFVGSFIPNWLLERRDVSQGAKLAYARLCQFAGKDGAVFPKRETLADEIGVTTRQVDRYLKELCTTHGLIEIKRCGLGDPNVYFFLQHPWMSIPESTDVSTPESTFMSTQDSSEMSSQKSTDKSTHLIGRRESEEENYGKGAKAPDPAVNAFKKFWEAEYIKRFENPYHFNHGKDGALVKGLLGTYELPVLQDRAVKFFDLDDDWVRTKGGFTLGVFHGQINKLNSIGRIQTPTRREMPA